MLSLVSRFFLLHCSTPRPTAGLNILFFVSWLLPVSTNSHVNDHILACMQALCTVWPCGGDDDQSDDDESQGFATGRGRDIRKVTSDVCSAPYEVFGAIDQATSKNLHLFKRAPVWRSLAHYSTRGQNLVRGLGGCRWVQSCFHY